MFKLFLFLVLCWGTEQTKEKKVGPAEWKHRRETDGQTRLDACQTVMDPNRSVTESAGSLRTDTTSTAASVLLLSENTLQVELSETQVTRRTTRGQNPQLEGKNLQNKTTREPSLQNKIIQEQSQWSSRCKGQNQRPRGHHCKNNRTWRTRQKETRSVRPKPAQQRTEWQNQQLEDRTWNNWSEVGEQSQWSSGCGGQNQTSGQHHRRTRRQNLRDRTTGELNQWSRRTIWQNMQNQKSQNNTTQLLNSRMNGTKWTWRM